MKIFFLSDKNSCRSQMAEAILRSFDKDIEIYSAGIEPADHVSKIAIEVMAEIGIDIKQETPVNYSEFSNMEFDYLITVGDGTADNLKLPPVKFKRKMHLGFHNPFKETHKREEQKQKCRDIRDEIKTELEYFYHKIIRQEV